MRHERSLRHTGSRLTGVARLFELHRQNTLQSQEGRILDTPETLRADIAARLRDQATQSLQPRQVDDPR